VSLKDLPLVTVALRMLLPDERILGGSVQEVEVVPSQGPQLDSCSSQPGLKIEARGWTSGLVRSRAASVHLSPSFFRAPRSAIDSRRRRSFVSALLAEVIQATKWRR